MRIVSSGGGKSRRHHRLRLQVGVEDAAAMLFKCRRCIDASIAIRIGLSIVTLFSAISPYSS